MSKHHFSKKEGEIIAGGWFEAGKLLRVEADLDSGCMRVAVVGGNGDGAEGETLPSMAVHMRRIPFLCINYLTLVMADWRVAFPSGVRPSASVGAALFPAVSGRDGARVRCNFGLDQRRPLRYPPQWMVGLEEREEQVRRRRTIVCLYG